MSILSPGTELSRFRSGLLPRIAIAVLLFIPLIYGALYLWAFWSPTENLDQVAVALVDEDHAVTREDGTVIDAGTDVVEALLESGDLGWVVTDADDAAAGVSDGTYYFSVTIPEEFSADVASVDSDDAEVAALEVHYNETNSFLATTLGRTAMTQVQEAVADSVSAQTALTLIEGVETLAEGIDDAADGATQLSDGTDELADGATTLSDGLTQLAEGSDALLSGTSSLFSGSVTLADGASTLASGAGDLASGASQLSDGADTLASGADTLADGSTSLATGAASLADGASDLDEGLTTLDAGANTLASSLAALEAKAPALAQATGQLSAGASQLSSGVTTVAQLAAAYPTMTLEQLEATLEANGTSLDAIASGAQTLAAGTEELNTTVTVSASEDEPSLVDGISQLSAGAAKLAAGLDDAAAGAASLDAGAASVASGASQLDDGTGALAEGADDVADGAAQVADGALEVASGASALSSGASDLSDGAGQVNDGAATLSEGASEAADGSTDLADGATQVADGADELSVALSEGAEEAPTITDSQAASMSEIIADPVVLADTTDNETQGFGEGFAPFFIALATFVGALITWLILRPLPVRLLATRASGLRAVLTGFVPAALLGLGQTVIMVLVLVLGIGVTPVHLIGMTLFVLLTTLAFLALQQMFVVLLGSAAGRVTSLVLLMLQLSSSSGTYPVETSPGFFQALHPYMPASYVVDGLRALIGGGVDARFWTALAYMVALLVVSLAVSAFAAGRQKVWTIARLHPELSI